MNLLALFVIGLGASLAPLDFAINIAFPAITEAFALQTQTIRWVALCYVLTYGSLVIWFGSIGDRIGHLKVFRAGLVLAIISLAICAMSPSYLLLVSARVMQGIAMALTLSCAPALVIAVFPEYERTRALSVYGSMTAFSGIIAPVAGGVFLSLLDWPGVFWFRVPIAIVALACLPMLKKHLRPMVSVRSSHRQSGSSMNILRQVYHENQDFGWVNLASMVVQLASFVVPLLMPYYLIRVAQWNPLETGGVLAVWAIGIFLGSAMAGRFTRQMGTHRATFAAAWLCSLSLFSVALWSSPFTIGLMILSVLFQGIGLGLFQVAYADWVVAALPVTSRGVAGSLTVMTRTIGIITGALLWLWIFDYAEATSLKLNQEAQKALIEAFRQVTLIAAFISAIFFAASGFRFWRR